MTPEDRLVHEHRERVDFYYGWECAEAETVEREERLDRLAAAFMREGATPSEAVRAAERALEALEAM